MSYPTTPQPFHSDSSPVRNLAETELWTDLANVVYASSDEAETLTIKMPVRGRLQIWAMANISNGGAGGVVALVLNGVNMVPAGVSINDETICLVQYADLDPGVYTLALDGGGIITTSILTARRGRIPSTV